MFNVRYNIIRSEKMNPPKTQRKGLEMSNAATTIYQQIGPRTFAMIGAKNFSAHGNCLTFRPGRNPKRVTAVQVELDKGSDTYIVRFFKGSGINMKKNLEISDVYVDMLHDVLERNLELYTRL